MLSFHRQSWKIYQSDERLWLKNHHHGIRRTSSCTGVFWRHFCRKLDATFLLLQFLPFFDKTEYGEYALQNSLCSNLIASTKLDRIVSIFFLVFRLSVNNKTRVNIWHSCHARIQINVDNAIYWKKRNDFLNNPYKIPFAKETLNRSWHPRIISNF